MSGSVSINKPAVMANAEAMSFAQTVLSMSGNFTARGQYQCSTATGAVPMMGVTTPGVCMFSNMDGTNTIKLRNGSSGTDTIQIPPGQWAIVPWMQNGTVYATAGAGTPVLDYLLGSA